MAPHLYIWWYHWTVSAREQKRQQHPKAVNVAHLGDLHTRATQRHNLRSNRMLLPPHPSLIRLLKIES